MSTVKQEVWRGLTSVKERSQEMNTEQNDHTEESLRPTHVVTSFLLRRDTAEPLIMIAQRSQRVGSYHGQWAGISGFVEAGISPDEQAYTEIREETGLEREQVRMLRRGAIVEHVDLALGRHFYIHPFLFEVFAPEAIRIDWEANEMRWIAPTELENYETVPKLREVYDAAFNGVLIM
jgi:8-oxo-dGTP diphosphatase